MAPRLRGKRSFSVRYGPVSGEKEGKNLKNSSTAPRVSPQRLQGQRDKPEKFFSQTPLVGASLWEKGDFFEQMSSRPQAQRRGESRKETAGERYTGEIEFFTFRGAGRDLLSSLLSTFSCSNFFAQSAKKLGSRKPQKPPRSPACSELVEGLT